MSRRRTHRRSKGAWPRFVASVVALGVVAGGIPQLLLLCSTAGLGTLNPLPAIGGVDEIRSYLNRGLSNTELTPILIRTLLVAGWALWAMMMLSVTVALVAAMRGHAPRRIPIAAVFAPLSRWIIAGLSAVTTVAPSGLAGAVLNESPRPFTVSRSLTVAEVEADARPIEAPTRVGYARVRPGESVEKFAARTLGDASRWREIWDINHNQSVGPAGEAWTVVFQLEAGWELALPGAAPLAELPASTGPSTSPPAMGATTDAQHGFASTDAVLTVAPMSPAAPIGTHIVQPGDTYWKIATSHLPDGAPDGDIVTYAGLLMGHNAPRLGNTHPSLIRPGDELEVLAPPNSAPTPTGAAVDPAGVADTTQPHVVQPGDSYWSIAASMLPPDASSEEIAARTQVLIAWNAPLLGHADPQTLHPGDLVHLDDPAAIPEPPVAGPAVAEPAPGAATDADLDSEAAAPAPLPPPRLDTRPEPASPLPDPPAPPAEAPVPPPPAELADELAAGAVTGATTAPRPADQPPDAEPTADSDDARGDPTVVPLGLGLGAMTAVAAAGVSAMFVARRRRASRCRPHERPAPIPEQLQPDADALMLRDTSDVVWLSLELRWLAHHCPPELRSQMTVQLVRLTVERDLEVAFEHPIDGEPPEGWTAVSDRRWRLEWMHTADDLDPFSDDPPVVPGLVSLGHSDHGQLFINLEAGAGIALGGDTATQLAWLTNTIWEIAPAGIAAYSEVLLVDIDELPGIDHLDNVMVVCDPSTARERLTTDSPDTSTSMLDRRVDRLEAWETTVVVLGPTVNPHEWRTIAQRPDVAVIALDNSYDDSLNLTATDDGTIHVDRLGITVDPVQLDEATVDQITALLTAAAHPPVDDPFIATFPPPSGPASPDPTVTPATANAVAVSTHPAVNGDGADSTVDESWEPPQWRVMVKLLGTPAVTIGGHQLDLQPQLLAALAYIAIKRETSTDTLSSAIWGDGERIPERRPRDLLHRLRKSAGGPAVVGRSTDGIVRAGTDLGCDLMVVEALAERARTHPHEWAQRMQEILDLCADRPFNYTPSAQASWRWVDLELLHATWESRVATTAYELANHHLDDNRPHDAVRVAYQGLHADPLNSALSEVLMSSYAALGAFDKAQQVYESHDRAMADNGFGGATEATRELLDKLTAHHRRGVAHEVHAV